MLQVASTTWSCSACTLENKPGSQQCLGDLITDQLFWNKCVDTNKIDQFLACGTSKQKRKSLSEMGSSESKRLKMDSLPSTGVSTAMNSGIKSGQNSVTGLSQPSGKNSVRGTSLPTVQMHPGALVPRAKLPGAAATPAEPPGCRQHAAPCIKRTVVKAGPNKGRLFYACSLPR